MAKLTRVTAKLFGGSAPLSEIGQFGSALAGTPTNTQDVATIQALSAYDNGWGSAVISARNFPPIEEVNGVLKTISYQNCYLLQEGVPEYDANTEYGNTSIVKSINGNELSFYISLQNGNIGNALSDDTYWIKAVFTGSSRIGDPQVTLNFSGTLPANCIWLEGATVSRTTYSTLFGIYGTTYGEGDGSTTFQLPDFRNRAIWGADTAGYLAAGLPTPPNHSHTTNGSTDQDDGGTYFTSGATRNKGNLTTLTTPNWNNHAIYGKSTTVQPPSIKVRVYTRYQ